MMMKTRFRSVPDGSDKKILWQSRRSVPNLQLSNLNLNLKEQDIPYFDHVT